MSAPLRIEQSYYFDALAVGQLIVDGQRIAAKLRGVAPQTMITPSTIEIPVYSTSGLADVRFVDGFIQLRAANRTYTINTQIERVVFENHSGQATFEWYSRLNLAAVSSPFTIRGSGETNPSYGFTKSTFNINYADTIGLRLINNHLLKEIESVRVSVAVV